MNYSSIMLFIDSFITDIIRNITFMSLAYIGLISIITIMIFIFRNGTKKVFLLTSVNGILLIGSLYCLGTIIVLIQTQQSSTLPIINALMICLSSTIIGGTVGFLVAQGFKSKDPNAVDNNGLERVSAIILGIIFAEYHDLHIKLENVSKWLGNKENEGLISTFIVSYLLFGFLTSYLFTKLKINTFLARADQNTQLSLNKDDLNIDKINKQVQFFLMGMIAKNINPNLSFQSILWIQVSCEKNNILINALKNFVPIITVNNVNASYVQITALSLKPQNTIIVFEDSTTYNQFISNSVFTTGAWNQAKIIIFQEDASQKNTIISAINNPQIKVVSSISELLRAL